MSEARHGGHPVGADLVPENAPFDEEQRAWLNGFLAGLLGLANGEGRAVLDSTGRLVVDPAARLSPGVSPGGAVAPGTAPADPGNPAPGNFALGGGSVAAGRESASAAEPPLAAPGGDAPDARTAAVPAARLAAERARGLRPDRAAVAAGAARRVLRAHALEALAPLTSASPRTHLVGAGREPGAALRLRVKSQKKLTLADAGSEIREVVLELERSDVSYQAGDCLAVFPHNDPDLVRSLLRAVGARGQEIVSSPSGATEVWRCLLEDLDITHVREETLRLFAEEAGRSDELGALRESLSNATPSSFDLLDLLAMFPTGRPSLDRIVGSLGTLEPRLYAIASSPTYHPGELHLAVRVVRAERGGRERKGVASHFLSDGVFRGDDVYARVQTGDRFALPSDRSGPMIMLGSGTGVARYRALLQELEARGRRGNTWLIMASCCEGDEALYHAELETWSRIGVLEHLDVVKMGQRGRRIGPEDVLRKRARRVVSWLERGAFLYASGEGRALSAVLEDTLIDVLGRQGKMSRAEAADYIQALRRDGRYVEEVY
jgi:sulfite reductase (NADPH) flavoprotein alpha-component